MPEKYLEISQFIDDELNKDQSIRLLYKLAEDKQLDAAFRRYEAISQAMKTEVMLPLPEDFVERVNQAIQNEPIYWLPDRNRRKKTLYRLSALAASIAIAAVFVMHPQTLHFGVDGVQKAIVVAENNEEKDISKVVSKGQNKANDTTESIALVAGSRHMQRIFPDSGVRLKPVAPEFNDYLQAHSGSLYSSDASFQTYAQVVGYGQE